jgi:hypothetical protein
MGAWMFMPFFPCEKGGMGVKMQVLIQVSPFILFLDTRACLLGKNGGCLKTLEARCLATT